MRALIAFCFALAFAATASAQVTNPGVRINGAFAVNDCVKIVSRTAVASSGAACAGTPGGAASTLQYNNAGAFGGVTSSVVSGANVTFGGTIGVGASDVILLRDAANTLALRNSTTGQAFRVYNTYTDASNLERLTISYSGNVAYIGTEAVGTGLAGHALNIYQAQNSTLGFWTNSVERWDITSSGNLVTFADNAYDIGASGAARPRTGYFGTKLIVGAGSAEIGSGYLGVTNAWYFAGASAGIVRLEPYAGPGDVSLLLGGSTSSFPALVRNGIKLEAKLADNSTYASIAARGVIVAGAVPTLALAGGTCAGTVIAGGSTAGTVTLTGICAATNTLALTVMPTAPTGYACDAIDRTLGSSLLTETGTTTTSVTFTFGGTTGATDVLAYKCLAY